MKILTMALLGAITSTSVFASPQHLDENQRKEDHQETVKLITNLPSSDEDFHSSDSRFQPFGLNYLSIGMASGERTPGKDAAPIASKVHFSFRYFISDCRRELVKEEEKCHKSGKKPTTQHFISYTGEFDFYFLTRPSSPVTNRVSNLAYHHYRTTKTDNNPNPWLGIDYIDFGLEHRSNGQTVDSKKTVGDVVGAPFETVVNYDIENHPYFDSLSRNTNYISTTFGSLNGNMANGNRLNWQISSKLHFFQEADINWGKYANLDVNYNDYDVLKFTLEGSFFYDTKKKIHKMKLITEYTIGTGGFDQSSVDLYAIFPLISKTGKSSIPLMIKYHQGPMYTLANYTKNTSYLGFGLALAF